MSQTPGNGGPQSVEKHVEKLIIRFATVKNGLRNLKRDDYPERIANAMRKGISKALDDCVDRDTLQKFPSDLAKSNATDIILEETITRTMTSVGGSVPRSSFLSLHASFLNLSNKILHQQVADPQHAQIDGGQPIVDPPIEDLDRSLDKGSGQLLAGISSSHDPGPKKRSPERKITLHFTNQTLVTELFALSIRDISLQLRQAIASDFHVPAHPRGGNWIVEVTQLENGDLEVFTETAEDRAMLVREKNWAWIFEETVKAMMGSGREEVGDIDIVGGVNPQEGAAGPTADPENVIDLSLPPTPCAPFMRQPILDTNMKSDDDRPIGKYDPFPFPILPQDPSLHRLNSLSFPSGTQASPTTPATAPSSKRKAPEPEPAPLDAETETVAKQKKKKPRYKKQKQQQAGAQTNKKAGAQE